MINMIDDPKGKTCNCSVKKLLGVTNPYERSCELKVLGCKTKWNSSREGPGFESYLDNKAFAGTVK